MDMSLEKYCKYIKICLFKKYCVVKGRAGRQEFFSYALFFIFFILFWATCLLSLIGYFGDINLIDFVLLYVPFIFVTPFVAVTVRRFHDCSKTGWLVLLLFVPIINLFGFALLCMKGKPGGNRYGYPDRD